MHNTFLKLAFLKHETYLFRILLFLRLCKEYANAISPRPSGETLEPKSCESIMESREETS